MEKILFNYVCPSLELMEEEIDWEEIPSAICDYKDYLKTMEEIKEEEKLIKEYDNFCKSLDDLSEDEQLDYLSDIIYNSLFE